LTVNAMGALERGGAIFALPAIVGPLLAVEKPFAED